MTKETVKTSGTVYEVGFHIVPAVSPENLPKEVDAIKAVLGAHGATIISEEAPKLRPLTFTMVKVIGQNRHKYDTAHFGWIKFETTPEAAVEINSALATSEKILRYLLIKTVAENTLYGEKLLPQEKEAGAKTDEAAKEAAPVVAAEIDKAVEKIVA
ncbi:MAG: 30S ribosomal protein S6 [Candidatus Paceibacterota bacterium]|jgi:ribosomal protein S6